MGGGPGHFGQSYTKYYPSSQFSDRHMWKIITHTQLRAVSRDLCLVTHVGTPSFIAGKRGETIIRLKDGKTRILFILVYIFIFSRKQQKVLLLGWNRTFTNSQFFSFYTVSRHLHVRPPATFAVKVLQLEHLVSDHLL